MRKNRAELGFVYHGFRRLAKASITRIRHYADDHSICAENIDLLPERAPIGEELAGNSRTDDYERAMLESVLLGQRAPGEKRDPHGFEECGAICFRDGRSESGAHSQKREAVSAGVHSFGEPRFSRSRYAYP